MTEAQWSEFPYEQADYDYPGDALEKEWARLHKGDREPFPDATAVEELCSAYPAAAESVPGFDGDHGGLAERLQEAWRLYHRGDFQQAADLGLSLGLPGYCVANKATLIYATYLEEDEGREIALYERIAERAEEAAAAMPGHANSHYFRAAALGRYSQGVSIMKALKEGVAGKVRESLDEALRLEPDHAEAHTAMGLYHAAIIESVGALVGGVTYGASKDAGMEHFHTALGLTPDAPIAHMEYGNGLLMMFDKKRLDEATGAYEEAASKEPADAMECLDMELARSELE